MIIVDNISKTFNQSRNPVTALNNITFNIESNSFTLIKGPSGCGKSTLLFTLGGMLKPNEGSVSFMGKDLYNMNEKDRRIHTRSNIGFVFQSYHLLPYLSVIDNINISTKLPFNNIDKEYVGRLLEELHLTERLSHKPSQLSIGEKQRVALVRSLACRPKLILADEPTGNLDPENSEIVLNFLNSYRNNGGTIVMVSHSSDADQLATGILRMKKGQIGSN